MGITLNLFLKEIKQIHLHYFKVDLFQRQTKVIQAIAVLTFC